ncbi:hypothetical protein GIB67_039175 [Kingdonia uniflora]|uniref:non-specific serine/threonine protein kinase n=1 Tax=Kingdonia uniflora TaxID=39325 RepID=A0A7J7MM07_9MAGN|nr:hypothetical protein GIB67_039175 [Kingdonia uniflora]
MNMSSVVPFSTSFIFSIAQIKNTLPGHGLVFIFAPGIGIHGVSSAQHLGLFNRTNNGERNNHVFGIEFDVFKNPEFEDIDDNHVGVNLNSLTSVAAQPAGYWSEEKDGSFTFIGLKLNNGVNYQVWVDYANSQLNVTIVRAGMRRPRRALITTFLDLSPVLLDEMYVGFCAATGRLVERHRILGWSFSNSDSWGSYDSLSTSRLPSFIAPGNSVVNSKEFIVGITVSIIFVISSCIAVYWCLARRIRRRAWEREAREEWELEYWPHRIHYREIYKATKGFSEENVIGVGGNGKVYKGVVGGGIEVAVKRFSHESEEGTREFLAEVSSLGRLKHRNLVGLRGWCKTERGVPGLILVYDFMENGSLDKRVFECENGLLLSWDDRVRVLKDVAAGILYLHQGWESRVLHRDIKASNVLLDRDMNGRLGDFGLARMHSHGQAMKTTRVMGTVGYMAPEVVRNGRASSQTDVFGFGILILEIICGRRPIEDGKLPLVDWVWELMEKGELVCALDERVRAKGEFNDEEVDRLLHLGLLCAYPDTNARPTIRQVVKLLEGKTEIEESSWDGMDVYLLDKTKSKKMWAKYRLSKRQGWYPTFEDFRQSLSSSFSLPRSSESDIIVEGR